MKKFFLSVATVAAMAFAAQAQFKITPKVGYTTSTWAISKEAKDDLKDEGGKQTFTSGFSAGVAFDLGLSESFSIQPEILYTQKGFRAKYDGGTEDSRFNYLEIPVLVKASFGDEDALRFFVYAGPYLGYALNGNYKAKGGPISISSKIKFGEDPGNNDDTYIPKDEANRLDIGAYVGAGISLPVGPGALSLEGRYGYGFTNFDKDPSGQAKKEDLKTQNRTIGVFLGYAIPLSGN